jgi:hypothetical protein
LARCSRPIGKTGWENRSSGCPAAGVPGVIAGAAGRPRGYYKPKKREVKWLCQVEEEVEDKAVDRAAEVRAGDRVAEAVAGKVAARAKAVAGKAAARGLGARIYAGARLAGPASPMNAGFPAFR